MKSFILILYFILISPSFLLSSTIPNIIIFETMKAKTIQERTNGLISYMQENGYINGKTIRLHRINAEQNRNLGTKLLKETISKYPPTLVVTNATMASQIAKKELEGTNIPLFFFGVTDPVSAGIVKDIEVAHTDLVTGSMHRIKTETIFNTVLKILSTTSLPKPYKIGIIYSSYPSSYNSFKVMQGLSKNADIQFVPINVEKIDYLEHALKTITKEFDYMWVTPGPLAISPKFVQHLMDIAPAPIIFIETMQYVKKGVLMAIDTDNTVYGREAGEIAVSILNGKSVTDIKVRRTKGFEFGINLTTANKMNVIIPSEILNLAKENLFK